MASVSYEDMQWVFVHHLLRNENLFSGLLKRHLLRSNAYFEGLEKFQNAGSGIARQRSSAKSKERLEHSMGGDVGISELKSESKAVLKKVKELRDAASNSASTKEAFDVMMSSKILIRKIEEGAYKKVASCNLLKNHLLLSNTSLCAVQLFGGDYLQQLLSGNVTENGWDISRSARLGASGLVIGPMMTVWYRFLDSRYVGNRLRIVIKKTLVDACTNPVYTSTIITVCGLLEGKKFVDAFRDYTSKWFYYLKMDLSIWPPSQFISFLLLPPTLRVIYINIVYLIYGCVLSFVKHNKKETIEKYM